jgi:hypothetical protein
VANTPARRLIRTNIKFLYILSCRFRPSAYASISKNYSL